MTVLIRWDPFRELSALQNRLGRLFEEQYGGREESLTAGRLSPQSMSTRTSTAFN